MVEAVANERKGKSQSGDRPDGDVADGGPRQGPEDEAALLYRRLEVYARLLPVLRRLERRRQEAAAARESTEDAGETKLNSKATSSGTPDS